MWFVRHRFPTHNHESGLYSRSQKGLDKAGDVVYNALVRENITNIGFSTMEKVILC